MSAEWPSDIAGTAAADVAVETTRAKAGEKAAEEGATAAATSKVKAEEEARKSEVKTAAATAKAEAEAAATSKTKAEEEARKTAVTAEEERAKAAEKKAREEAEAASIPLSQKGAHSGVATLDAGGLLSTAQLPPLALTDPYVVASEAAQLALAAHKGDFAIRTDIGKTFVQNGGVAGTMADWTEIVTPGDVTSVNGKTGTVNLTAANVGADASGAATAAQSGAEAASIPLSQKAAASGVASLTAGSIGAQLPAHHASTHADGGSDPLTVAYLPASVVSNRLKALGEVEGVVRLKGSEADSFSATLKGAAELEVLPAKEPWTCTLFLTPGKYTWKIKSGAWVNSEPTFGEGLAVIVIECVEGKIILNAGPQGKTGAAGVNGSTIWPVTGVPEPSLGAVADFALLYTAEPQKLYGPKTSEGWGAAVNVGSKGATGATGAEGTTSQGGFLHLIRPIYAPGAHPNSEGVAVKFKALFARVVIERSGTLKEIYTYAGAEVEGELMGAVYDCGQKKAKAYRLLWQGTAFTPGAKKWEKLGAPELAVTAGEVLMLAVMTNNAAEKHKFGGVTVGSAGPAMELPSAFTVPGETLPKDAAKHTFTELKFGTAGTSELTEAQMEQSNSPLPILLGRVE